jgi:cbb3-type cytochrome oxidase maturation protein
MARSSPLPGSAVLFALARVVLPLALVVVLTAVAAFLWATSRGPFDDLDAPAVRLLHGDPEGLPANDCRGPGIR